MRITVIAKTNSAPSLRMLEENRYAISVREKPEHGKANEAIRKSLSKHFKISTSRISLVMGATSRTKLFVLS